MHKKLKFFKRKILIFKKFKKLEIRNMRNGHSRTGPVQNLARAFLSMVSLSEINRKQKRINVSAQ